MKPTITRKAIAHLRSEVANPNRFEPVPVNPNVLRVLLDAVEALDEIQAHAYRVVGYGIDVTVNRAPEREGCDQFVSGPTDLPGGDCAQASKELYGLKRAGV